MVSAWITIALLAASQVPVETSTVEAPVRAVVRVTSGRVTVIDVPGSEGRVAKSGLVVGAGVIVETGAEGWVELHVLGAGRVRLSAATRILLGEKGLRVLGGRVWIDHSDGSEERPWLVELPRARCRVARSTSAIVEHGPRSGSTVVVRRGRVEVEDDVGAVVLEPGQIASLVPGAGATVSARPGGVGLAELSELEAVTVLGDLAGVRRFLLDRVAAANVRRGAPRLFDAVLKSAPELSGVSATEWDLEAALKAPAFFEDEVPPKGPNVRVEVGFDE